MTRRIGEGQGGGAGALRRAMGAGTWSRSHSWQSSSPATPTKASTPFSAPSGILASSAGKYTCAASCHAGGGREGG